MLTSKAIKRIDLPHEPGEWIEVKMPSLSVLEAVGLGEGEISQSRIMLQKCIVGWSYSDPVNNETIDDLDFRTVQFIAEHIGGTPEALVKNG